MPEYPQDQIVKLVDKINKKIKIGFLSADLKNGHSITFLKTILLNYNKDEVEIYLFSNQMILSLYQKKLPI